MSFQSVWYFTNLPNDVVSSIERDLSHHFDNDVKESRLDGGISNTAKRDSKNTWVPSDHWVCGFLWHYVMKANRENYRYDLTNLDCESVQYTHYDVGQYYKWHNDAGLSGLSYVGRTETQNLEKQSTDYLIRNAEHTRKLSFVMQLSSADDYEGGNLQIMSDSGDTYFAPRAQGSIILFDSRAMHRVTKIKSGYRKSLVGWVAGPSWK
jgi:predicted 2-oxoglutarate/Fe(II)-dependent dioxygenase YbiX